MSITICIPSPRAALLLVAIPRISRMSSSADSNSRIVLHEVPILHRLVACLDAKFCRTRNRQDLDRVIALQRLMLDSSPPDSPDRWMLSDYLGQSRCKRHEGWGDMADLERAIVLWRDALSLCHQDNTEDRFTLLANLASSLLRRAQIRGDFKDADEIIELRSAAVSLLREGHPHRFQILVELADSFYFRFQQCGRKDDLNESIRLYYDALPMFSDGHPYRFKFFSNFGAMLMYRFEQTGKAQDLDESIKLCRNALAFIPDGHPRRVVNLGTLGGALMTRFQQHGGIDDLNESVELLREAVALIPSAHPDRFALRNKLGKALMTRFEQGGTTADLDESIQFLRSAIDLLPDGHPRGPPLFNDLGVALIIRFGQSGRRSDLVESIQMRRKAHALRARQFVSLNYLANALMDRFEESGSIGDLDEAIESFRSTLDILPDGHPRRFASLDELGAALMSRFTQGGRIEDMNEAIQLHRDALALCPDGHPNRFMLLINLGVALMNRFEQGGRVDDLVEAIDLYREALSLLPDGHQKRSISLNNLGNALVNRFQLDGRVDDLNESIRLLCNAVDLRPDGHRYRFTPLRNLGSALLIRFKHAGNVDDLVKAVESHRDALALVPNGHPARSMSLSNLGAALMIHFEQGGRADDLDEAIQLHRDALALRPEGHPHRSKSLINLGNALMARYEQGGRIGDLDESIQLYRDALSLLPDGHPDRPMSLGNLGCALRLRPGQEGRTDDLDESIRVQRDALALRPGCHRDRSMSLSNLGGALLTRFKQVGKEDDLNESIRLLRDAVALRPDSHSHRFVTLNNLGGALMARFEQGGSIDDLNESVRLYDGVLTLLQNDHPSRSGSLYGLADALFTRFKASGQPEERGDYEDCLRLLSEASAHEFSSPSSRLRAAYQWATLARLHNHGSTLTAYRTAIALLQYTLTLSATLSAQHDFLALNKAYQPLSVDAASYAIERSDLRAAIELLEQGRTILWTQMRGFRATLDRLVQSNKPLADRLKEIGSLLEALITTAESQLTGVNMSMDNSGGSRNRNSTDALIERVRRLSEERDEIISRIREVPGFEDFLRPPAFEKLQKAASEGPVIVLNHSVYRCDALILLSRENEPCISVSLDGDWFNDALDLCNDFLQARYEHGVHSPQYDETLQRVMRSLWDRVVANIIPKLKDLGFSEGSRIWWCPTRFLALLPFHAAGPFEASGTTKYLLDDYISSYTPTLRSLIAARKATRTRTKKPKVLFVGDTKNLRSTGKERNVLLKLRILGDSLVDDQASPDSVIELLRKTKWVHFACHGGLNQERPFESSFALPGGKLTLLDIAKANLPNAEFAFLSACHTAETPFRSAMDEALHLAAGMQFCGFRSVVGTMWQLLDRDGPVLAEAVYRHLISVEDGQIKFKHAAAAVREAALYRRSRKDLAEDGMTDVDVSTERWVNLIHIGA